MNPRRGSQSFYRIERVILIGEKRKESCQFGFVGTPAIFADFKCLGIFDPHSPVFAVRLLQLGAKSIGDRFISVGKAIAHFLMTLLLFLRIAGKQIGGAVGAAFVELGDDNAECVELLLNDRIDGNSDFRLKRIRFLKGVGVLKKHRIVFQGRYVGAEKRYSDHIRRVLNEHTGVTVVGMVIVRSRPQHHIGLPFPDEAR